mmetsp:Transcript_23064/g.46372  ORF Transcript_23064/g.46372 Transcript_23064/m.46372 type:complete len:567 (+) Transcript_23064:82-1782(+)
MFSFTQRENNDNVRGLRNLGNTCYLNAVLQTLSSCPSFVSYVEYLSEQKGVGKVTSSLSLLSDLRGPGNGPVNPNVLFNCLVKTNKEFRGNNQQDSLEVLESLLNCVKDENALFSSWRYDKMVRKALVQQAHGLIGSAKKTRMNNSSLPIVHADCLTNPFQGWMGSHIECQTCSSSAGPSSQRWMPTRHQVFTNLPLPIPTASSQRMRNQQGNSAPFHSVSDGKISLYHCLDEFFEQDALSGITCSACSIQSTVAAYKLLEQQVKHKKCKDEREDCFRNGGVQNDNNDQFIHQIVKTMLKPLSSMRVVGERDGLITDFDAGYSDITNSIIEEFESNGFTTKSRCGSESSGDNSPTSILLAQSSNDTTDTTDTESSSSTSFEPQKVEQVKNMFQSLRRLTHTDAMKRTAISRLPRLLCLYLCRRVYDDRTGKMRKVSDHVAFPTTLSMVPYFSPDGSMRCSSSSKPDASSGMNKFRTMGGRSTGSFSMGGIMGSAIAEAGNFGKFALRAVIEHSGNADTGHYIAYCLVQKKTSLVWEMFSDEMHKQVSEERVLAAQATMLFYERLTV